MIVLKFGGSSITKHGFDIICHQLLKNQSQSSEKQVVVLSAISNTTSLLIKFTETLDFKLIQQVLLQQQQLSEELELTAVLPSISIKQSLLLDCERLKQTSGSINSVLLKSKIIGYGEYFSTCYLYEYLQKHWHNKHSIKLVDSAEFITTKDQCASTIFMKSEFRCNSKIVHGYFKDSSSNSCSIIITQGFVASDCNSNRCVLSRGGSDTTAALIANSVKASRLEIWTDVNGIYDSDPNVIPTAKIIPQIDYDLCQEMAAMGAKVLHPYCILPCKEKNIPIIIRNTYGGANEINTIIGKPVVSPTGELREKKRHLALLKQKRNIVFHISSLSMWSGFGFMADVFSVFTKYGININIITTSQFEVYATTSEYVEKSVLKCVQNELKQHYTIRIISDCTQISLVGKDLLQSDIFQTTATKFISTFTTEYKRDIFITHLSSNNMCLSFVVSQSISDDFYQKFYNQVLLTEQKPEPEPGQFDHTTVSKWWYSKIPKIQAQLEKSNKRQLYLYNLPTVREKCRLMTTNLTQFDTFFYAMKANDNLSVLREIYYEGFQFECVSLTEVKFIHTQFPKAIILFTPNYCHVEEYRAAFEISNCLIVVDNLEVLKKNPKLFYGKSIGLRLDLDQGDGHHEKVITEGKFSKFGIPLSAISDVVRFSKQNQIRIEGLHSHRGSGIEKASNWTKTIDILWDIGLNIPTLRWIDIGGGFGVQFTQQKFQKINDYLETKRQTTNTNQGQTKRSIPIQFFVEPGRFLVSEAGILLSKVNLVRKKDNVNFVGVESGMNTLMRPTLYDAYHHITNISRMEEKKDTWKPFQIVGPICESGDILGKNRFLPSTTKESDILLIEHGGAYGHTMSNHYNMREPASEELFSG